MVEKEKEGGSKDHTRACSMKSSDTIKRIQSLESLSQYWKSTLCFVFIYKFTVYQFLIFSDMIVTDLQSNLNLA